MMQKISHPARNKYSPKVFARPKCLVPCTKARDKTTPIAIAITVLMSRLYPLVRVPHLRTAPSTLESPIASPEPQSGTTKSQLSLQHTDASPTSTSGKLPAHLHLG